jgi:LuxR family maltose regulon positive regulatory protein
MPLNPALVARPRVAARLAHAAAYPVVVIAAGAGYGKTTAVRHLLAGMPGAEYVAVPHGAGSLDAFVRALARGLRARLPDFAAAADHALIGASAAADPVEALAVWAAQHLEGMAGTIVLDDLHNTDIDKPGDVARFLALLVERLAAGPRWVFATRDLGALPTTTWTLYGIADDPVDGADLAMDAHDAEALAAEAGATLSADDVRHLVTFTGGWPFLLAYAIRSSRRVDDLHRVEQLTRDLTFRFLADALWSELAEPERALLCYAALLHEVALDDVLPGVDDVGERLRRLARTMPFLSISATGFSLHDLLREFVLARVRASAPPARRALLDETARIFERRGALRDALRTLIETGDAGAVHAFVERHFDTLIDDAYLVDGEAALAAFPIDDVARAPDAYLALAIRIAHLRRGYRQVAEEQRELLHRPAAWTYRIVALRSFWVGALNGGDLRSASPTITSLLASEPPALVEAFLLACRATIAANAGELGAARADLDRARLLAGEVASAQHALVVSTIGIAYEACGDLDAAIHESQRAARFSEERGAWHLAAGMRINEMIMATIASRAGALEAAAERAFAASRSGGNWAASRTAHQLLAYYHAISNRPDAAEAIVTADPAFPLVTLPNLFVLSRLCEAIVAIERGDVERGYHVLSERRDWMTYAYIAAQLRALAAALMGRDPGADLAAARDVLATSATAGSLHRGFPRYLEIATMLVLGRWLTAKLELQRIDRPEEAFADLFEAMRSMSDGPPFDGVVPALERAAAAPFTGFLAAVLLRTAARVRETGFSTSTIVLTAAESAVLLLIEQGWSYQEIAAHRGASMSTVKAQAGSVFRKLGTPGNRVRALREAHRRGLLP